MFAITKAASPKIKKHLKPHGTSSFRHYGANWHCIKDGMNIDPCMGSGHILCYLFDVLMQIYQDYGHTPREAVASILENNLYGLDINDRAAQLSYFAVMMKARQYDRRFFSRKIQPKVMAIQESNGLKAWSEVAGDSLVGGQLNFDDSYIQMADYLIETFHDAKEYGSILTVEPNNYDDLLGFIERVKQEDGNLLFRACDDSHSSTEIETLTQENISLSKADWDSFETSWDFERHPLV